MVPLPGWAAWALLSTLMTQRMSSSLCWMTLEIGAAKLALRRSENYTKLLLVGTRDRLSRRQCFSTASMMDLLFWGCASAASTALTEAWEILVHGDRFVLLVWKEWTNKGAICTTAQPLMGAVSNAFSERCKLNSLTKCSKHFNSQSKTSFPKK